MASFDPVSTASSLATAYTQGAQLQVNTQTKTTQATSAGLTKLQSALSAFNTAVSGLSGKKSLLQNSAAFSSTAYGTATASSSAAAGAYPVFVEQIASAHQVMFADLPAVPVPVTGKLAITVSGTSFDVDFSTADADGNGTLSQSEIARAINLAADNQGQVSATVVTSGSTTQMILTAGDTGAASQITLDTSALAGDAGNAAALADFKATLAAGQTLVAAQDAVIWLGAQGSGMAIQQASNTFTAIDGVSMTFTQAMSTGTTPITLTVASDDGGTADNVKAFVDAYNTLKKTLDELTQAGDADNNVAAGTFSSDASVRALRNRLSNMLRQDFGGQRLFDYGVKADRYGTLSLDTDKLAAKVAATPDGLDTLFGSASITASSGLLGGLDTYLDAWLDSASGQIARRQQTVQITQKSMARRQSQIDLQYDRAYQRYLLQFTQLQNLQAQMSQTSSIFDNLVPAST